MIDCRRDPTRIAARTSWDLLEEFRSMVSCLECRAELTFEREPVVDEVVLCKRCGTRLVVVDATPVELDYADDDEDDWEDDDWDEDVDEDEESA
jgi:lysine biosynthesis protein LysW